MAVKASRRHRENASKVDPTKTYPVEEAVKILGSFRKTKFDETVNLSVKLNLDPRKQEQNLRGAVSLPHGTGKSKRVIAFAEGTAAEAAKAAGAIEVGSAELVKKVEGGWTDFDVAVATPDMMRHVGKLGKVLGPQGKMPTPKSGTVTPDVATAVREFSAGKIEFRTDAAGNIHCPIGKRSFDGKKIEDNVKFMIERLRALKPTTVKGRYMQRVVISAAMSPGVAVTVDEQQSAE
ncbi:MAG: 50S ribosomal protein L1 [Planctomycetes bacterium]|nr:50S ribosomal protein L1 [Planctomycetota bacterium]NUQ35001.1 50S ribosomal protein L1 [Planctomycetaceae bacterium]